MQRPPELEDIPVVLIHRIQSFLPEKEAARACLSSKSWLHAWSTIPTLRFHQSSFRGPGKEDQRRKLENLVASTLERYNRENLPIENLELSVDIADNENSAFRIREWLELVLSSGSLKELSLAVKMNNTSYMSPLEILSCKTLKTVILSEHGNQKSTLLNPVINPVINCHSLLVLDLQNLTLTEQVLHDLFASCRLIEKIVLRHCRGFYRIQVKNLPQLRRLAIYTQKRELYLQQKELVEISNVPSLQSFTCRLSQWSKAKPRLEIMSETLTSLHLDGVNMEDSSFNMFISRFRLLKTLAVVKNNLVGALDVTGSSLHSLWLLDCKKLTDVVVHAPKLVRLCYRGPKVPSISCPETPPEQLEFKFHSQFFADYLKMSVFMTLWVDFMVSTKIHIKFRDLMLQSYFVDYSRVMMMIPPSEDVQELSFENLDPHFFKTNPVFVHALFSICHPKYVAIRGEKKFEICELILKEMMEDLNPSCCECDKIKCWRHYLKDVEVQGHRRKDLRVLLLNPRSILPDGRTTLENCSYIRFALQWVHVDE